MRKYRKFAEGGTSALDELASGREKGSFDEDVYARAKKFLERGGKDEAPRPVARSRAVSAEPVAGRPRGESVPSPEATPAASAATIPTGTEAAPASTGESTSGPTNVERVLAGLGVGAGVAGIGRGVMSAYDKMGKARAAAAKAAEIAKRPPPVTPAKMSEDFMAGLSRAAPNKRVGKPTIEAATKSTKKPAKTSPKSRSKYNEDEAGTEFSRGGKAYAKGGSVRGGGCERRGLRKCKVV